jgi:hypothetical protein
MREADLDMLEVLDFMSDAFRNVALAFINWGRRRLFRSRLNFGVRHFTRNPMREWLSQQVKSVLYTCTQRS